MDRRRSGTAGTHCLWSGHLERCRYRAGNSCWPERPVLNCSPICRWRQSGRAAQCCARALAFKRAYWLVGAKLRRRDDLGAARRTDDHICVSICRSAKLHAQCSRAGIRGLHEQEHSQRGSIQYRSDMRRRRHGRNLPPLRWPNMWHEGALPRVAGLACASHSPPALRERPVRLL